MAIQEANMTMNQRYGQLNIFVITAQWEILMCQSCFKNKRNIAVIDTK